jgi:deoxyadenosine/deoxycytidine kinase
MASDSCTFAQVFHPKNLIIGVSGIIAAGKTTICQHLAEAFDATVYSEPVAENPYLERFYDDPVKYSFPMQIFMFNHRVKQHNRMTWATGNAIQDRTLQEDQIFALVTNRLGLMDELDFQNYCDIVETMKNSINFQRPDVIVFLDVSPEIALQRINHRNRECERSIGLDYLQALQKGYEEWLETVEVPVLRIPWDVDHTDPQTVVDLLLRVQLTLRG